MSSPIAVYLAQRDAPQRKSPHERTYTHILGEARDTTHRVLAEMIHQAKQYAQYEHDKQAKLQRYMNSPVPADCLDLTLRPSPNGPLSRQSSVASSPPRISRTSAPPMVPSQLDLNSPLASDQLIYPWEMETPKAMPRGRMPRHDFEPQPPSLWNLGAPNRPQTATEQSQPLYNLLQHVKDEDMAAHLQGRPYESNLWIPLPNKQQQRPATSEPNTPGRRTHMVWRPRPGFPGALAQAPAGFAAMLAEVKATCPADLPSLPRRPMSDSGRRVDRERRISMPQQPYEAPAPALQPAVSLQSDLQLRPSSARPSSGRRSSVPSITTSSSSDITLSPHPTLSSQALDTDTPPLTPTGSSKCATPTTPSKLPTIKRPTSVFTTVVASQVWVGNRGKVVHGQVVP